MKIFETIASLSFWFYILILYTSLMRDSLQSTKPEGPHPKLPIVSLSWVHSWMYYTTRFRYWDHDTSKSLLLLRSFIMGMARLCVSIFLFFLSSLSMDNDDQPGLVRVTTVHFPPSSHSSITTTYHDLSIIRSSINHSFFYVLRLPYHEECTQTYWKFICSGWRSKHWDVK